MEGLAGIAFGSTSGIEVTVVGTPFLRSPLLTAVLLVSLCVAVHVAMPDSQRDTHRAVTGVTDVSGWASYSGGVQMEVAVTTAQRVRVMVRATVPPSPGCCRPRVPRRCRRQGPARRRRGIVVNGDTYCTLTTIGTDKTGALIGFTSAPRRPGPRLPPSPPGCRGSARWSPETTAWTTR